MPTTALKMFGLQRSCTNVVIKGLKKNYFIDSQERGREWKHGPVKKSGVEVPAIVFCFREPLAWLLSMYNWSFSRDKDGCPHFQRTWSFNDYLINQHYRWPNPLTRWNEMNRHYLEFAEQNPEKSIVVRSEDMMSPQSAKQQYLRIGDHFKLTRKFDVVHVFKRRVNNTQKLLSRQMNFSYYTDRQYLSQYPEALLLNTIHNVDSWVAEKLNYTDLLR